MKSSEVALYSKGSSSHWHDNGINGGSWVQTKIHDES